MKQQRQYSVIYGGGLDQVTPPLQADPGTLISARNYEADLNNGYRIMAGYERADGRTSPTGGLWTAVQLADPSGYVLGETVTGGTSAATGVVIYLGVTGVYLASVVGTFVEAELLVGASASEAIIFVATGNSTLDDADIYNDVRYAKELHYRDFIAEVPGIGPVRGIHRHLGTLYAWRDFDGSECRLYKATAAGWALVTFGHIVFVTAAINSPSAIGVTVSDGTNTATLAGVVWTTVAETDGYYILMDYTAGFAASDTVSEGATALSTVSESAVPVVQTPGGRYEMFSHNFRGTTDGYAVWGCDGVNQAFNIDPLTDWFVPVYTDQENRTADIPNFTSVYRNHWFVGFDRGIIRNSEPGDPFLWDAAAGSLEIGVGAGVTGFDTTPLSLTVTTTRITYALTGQVKETFQLDVASSQTGARPYTVQHLGTTYMLDDRGVIELNRVQAFGNFENSSVSRRIKVTVDELLPLINASVVSRSKNIYRLMAADGRGLSMTLQDGNIISFLIFELDRGVSCTSNAEDETGAERIYFGSDDGFVYEMDRGRSWDGDAKEAWLQPAAHYRESPTVIKRFYRMYIDAVLEGTTTLDVFAEFSLGSADKNPTDTISKKLSGQVSVWDRGLWDRAIFDARSATDAHIELTGSGDSISTIFYSNSATDDLLTLKDVVYHYKPRRSMRGSR